MSRSAEILREGRKLARSLRPLRFSEPVAYVYNPLEYAWNGYEAYVTRFADSRKRVLFLGMNPGPFGMVQTGVPFGVADLVRDWLQIDVEIGKPAKEHPARPVLGLQCPRREVSGARLWGAVAEHFRTPDLFFVDNLVGNYCPLAFIEASGRNRTPDKLPAAECEPLYAACDRHLKRVVEVLEPEWLVGIGNFAEQRARTVLAGAGVKIGRILHPSPANPRSSRDWPGTVKRELREQGICPLVV